MQRMIFVSPSGTPVELVCLIGRHVVTLCEGTRDGDCLYLNNTLIACDKLGADTYVASEMFQELTGTYPYEFEAPTHPSDSNNCGCPCNCKWRGYDRGW